jgi:hypothetical protein
MQPGPLSIPMGPFRICTKIRGDIPYDDNGDTLWPVSLIPGIHYRRGRCYRRKINRRCHGIDKNPGQSLITGNNDTGDNLSPVTTTLAIIYHRCRRLSC